MYLLKVENEVYDEYIGYMTDAYLVGIYDSKELAENAMNNENSKYLNKEIKPNFKMVETKINKEFANEYRNTTFEVTFNPYHNTYETDHMLR